MSEYLISPDIDESELPPDGHPLRVLGLRLGEMLDEDHWAEGERLLLKGWKRVCELKTVVGPLIAIARTVEEAFDGNEEGTWLRITDDQAARLSELLDQLDSLPDDKPGYTLGAAAKAEWAIEMALGPAIPKGVEK